jgi:hypothetical protein
MAVVAAFAPVPLVACFVAYDSGSLASRFGHAYWFALVGVLFSVSVGALVVKVKQPQYMISRGSALWLLVTLAGGVFYFLGSYYGSLGLHLVGIPLVYIGLVAYMGGGRLAGLVALPIAALGSPAIPLYFGGLATEVGVVVLLALSGVLLLGSRYYRAGREEACEQCKSYQSEGSGFCEYCGRKLAAAVRFPLPVKRLILAAVVSVLVVSTLVVATLPVVSFSGSGFQIAYYRLSGVEGISNVPSYPGWTTYLTGTTSNHTLSTLSYVIKGNVSVDATVSVSRSPEISSEGALSSYNESKPAGTVILSPGQTGLQYTWSRNGVNYTGLLIGSPLTYISDGRVAQSYATFFFAQPSVTPSGPVKNVVADIANATSSELQGTKSGYDVLTFVVSPIQTYYQYAMLVGAGAFFCVVAGVVRSADSDAALRFDNSVGFSDEEMDALAVIAAGPRNFTWKQLAERMRMAKDWRNVGSFLEKLLDSGLVSKEIVTERGAPKITWKSKARL